ncbi:uncharacterized protein LOC123533822 [Mercenaria mercenaria]|uniref:uncharacterized protein LOC123533822 n=1 Tax=Mercenaria mercenaria TaxID=6596 RepID=UPI00234F92EE|nr:uncharacterized protein LOC123533822 [Mercenaria mercenaria]XP_045171659.2 uncharacterized protein LOC123533822 [Mercenaria mercenaria]
MASKKCSDLVRQAHSSRLKHVYNALVEIRKTFMKTPKDVAALVGARLVQRLLDLIRSRDSLEEQYRSKVIDISLSILGNMCMEEVTRKQVLKDKRTGVTILVELFEEIEQESLQNRACRCLSNLLLDPGSWELVCCSSVIEKIVKLLKDTEKEEYKQTCIRALRLLGQTGSHVQKLVEKNAVSVVSKLIDSDIDPLKSSALRCVHSLSIHGGTLHFASQIIASGQIPYLLTLVKDYNIEAFQIINRLCEHHNFRAEFGNAGGITIFHDGFQSKELFWTNLREDLLSVLCLCCKEAVNRVKLRDENILIFFIKSLSDDKFKNLHARIVSGLVCFLYDETSFDVLLENGLVPLLVKHLKSNIMHLTADSQGEKEVKLESNEEKEDVLNKAKFEIQSNIPSNSYQNISDERKAENTETVQDTKPKQNVQKVEDTEKDVEVRSKESREIYTIQNRYKPVSESDTEGIRIINQPMSESDTEGIRIINQPVSESDTEGIRIINQPMSESDTEGIRIINQPVSESDTEGIRIINQPMSESDTEGIRIINQPMSESDTEGIRIINQRMSESDTEVIRIINQPMSESDTEGIRIINQPMSESDTEGIRIINQSDDKTDCENECKNVSHEKKVNARPVYSIDSPSYQPNIEWEFEENQGAKCIERFTPPHTVDYSYKSSYSPLSNSSYYSPGGSSPEYSPPSSPKTSTSSQRASRNIFSQTSQGSFHGNSIFTGSQSPEYLHPKYTGISCRLDSPSDNPVTSQQPRQWSRSPYSSDASSPERGSEEEVTSNMSPGAVSSNSFDELSEDPFTSEGCHAVSVDSPTSEGCHAVSVDSPTNVDQESVNASLVFDIHFEMKDKNAEDSNRHGENQRAFDKETNEKINEKLIELKEKLLEEEKHHTRQKKVPSSSNVTEYNILVLLSRVSQMTDPTMHLVTKEVIHCLFDYMSIMEFPLARCPRLLSRVFRNPLCFNKLMTYGVPSMIFDNFLKFEDLDTLTVDIHHSRKTIKRKSIYGKAEIHHEISTDSDRFSFSDDSSQEEKQAHKRRRLSEDTENPKRSHSFKGQYHKQEEGICNTGKSAMAFLEDLSGIVDSNYGRGAIDRLLHTAPRDQIVELCINILSITWTQASRQYFFNQREILDQVLSVLQPYSDVDYSQIVHAVNSLRLLVHAIGTKSKYQIVRHKHSKREDTEQSTSRHASRKISSNRGNSATCDNVFLEEIMQENQETKLLSDLQGKGTDLDRSRSCCLLNTSVTMDTVFVVQNEKVSASRGRLVEKSEIFAAMLEGHYSEAQSSEIKIPESSKFAFKYLIHHLHGCKQGQCTYIDQLYYQEVNKQSAEQCIALLEEANKYMVTKLCDMASECLLLRYVIPESAFLVLKSAVLHRKDNLLKASVSCVFYDSSSVKEVLGHMCEILSSCYGDVFLVTLREILTE